MFERFGEDAWRFVDPRLVECFNAVREYLGKSMTLNDYYRGGDRRWSGIRTSASKYYSQFSAHSFGMAGDAVGDFNYDHLRDDIRNGTLVLPYPVRLELGVNWLHLDVAHTGTGNRVIAFKP